jgi:hypothetical protein
LAMLATRTISATSCKANTASSFRCGTLLAITMMTSPGPPSVFQTSKQPLRFTTRHHVSPTNTYQSAPRQQETGALRRDRSGPLPAQAHSGCSTQACRKGESPSIKINSRIIIHYSRKRSKATCPVAVMSAF